MRAHVELTFKGTGGITHLNRRVSINYLNFDTVFNYYFKFYMVVLQNEVY